VTVKVALLPTTTVCADGGTIMLTGVRTVRLETELEVLPSQFEATAE
jgi:hypothetical protein